LYSKNQDLGSSRLTYRHAVRHNLQCVISIRPGVIFAGIAEAAVWFARCTLFVIEYNLLTFYSATKLTHHPVK
jgi:hypothetical protein